MKVNAFPQQDIHTALFQDLQNNMEEGQEEGKKQEKNCGMLCFGQNMTQPLQSGSYNNKRPE